MRQYDYHLKRYRSFDQKTAMLLAGFGVVLAAAAHKLPGQYASLDAVTVISSLFIGTLASLVLLSFSNIKMIRSIKEIDEEHAQDSDSDYISHVISSYVTSTEEVGGAAKQKDACFRIASICLFVAFCGTLIMYR